MRYEVDQREEHSENARDIPVKIKSLSRSKNDRKIHSEKLKKNKLTDKEFRKYKFIKIGFRTIIRNMNDCFAE